MWKNKKVYLLLVIFLIGFSLIVSFYKILFYEQKRDVPDITEAKEATGSTLHQGVLLYIYETKDYKVEFNFKRTATIPEIIRALKNVITIDNTKYGPYIIDQPHKDITYEDVLQNFGIKIQVSNQGKEVCVYFSKQKKRSSYQMIAKRKKLRMILEFGIK